MLILISLLYLGAIAQEQRTDTIIPKFLINGYFFRELPELPDATPSYTRLKDSEGNKVLAIGLDVDLPESVIKQAIPREQVRNADQFLNGANMMATMLELAQAGVKEDGTFYSPKAGKEQFPDVMFFSATYHDAEVVQKITEKHNFTWTHLVEAKDMMSWIGTEGFPFTVVVDRMGIVRYAVHGTSQEIRAELIAKIKEAEGI